MSNVNPSYILAIPEFDVLPQSKAVLQLPELKLFSIDDQLNTQVKLLEVLANVGKPLRKTKKIGYKNTRDNKINKNVVVNQILNNDNFKSDDLMT